MRLIITDLTAQDLALKDILKFSHKKENWFELAKMALPPGDRNSYSMKGLKIRRLSTDEEIGVDLSYIITLTDGVLARHLTISRSDYSDVPDPITVFTICRFLGFKGSMEDWDVGPHPEMPRIAISSQEVTEDELDPLPD